MAHEKLNLNFPRDWSRAQAKLEPDDGITSVGGLAHRVGELSKASEPARQEDKTAATSPSISADPNKRLSLGKFIELSRRRRGLSVEQLASQANVDLAELLAMEKAEDIVPEPRTIYQLAQMLQVRPAPLLELAGLVVVKSTGLTESAIRFAARSEPTDALSKEEEEALNWFVKELTKT